jgi:hypothetical protein
MSGGGDLTAYQGDDLAEMPEGQLSEGPADTVQDIKDIVESMKEDQARGVRRGTSIEHKRQTQGDAFSRRIGLPKSFSEKAAAHWANLPRAVKGDVRKIEADRDGWRAAANSWAPLMPFAKLCASNGTTLERALHEYNALENLFIRDPVEAVGQMCQRLGIDPRAMINAAIARLNNPGMYTPAPQQQQQQADPAAAAVNQMAKDPRFPHFMQLRQRMSQLISNGASDNLAHAYMLAFNERSGKSNVVARARAAAKAVSGAPSSGHVPSGVGPASDSRRDIIRAAIAAQRGEI